MDEESKAESVLGPFRVLDLADETGDFCGKLLGDLGADVIKIEKPGGDPSRNIGPFYHDIPDPEKSLRWFANNTSKRSITLDIETARGQMIFKRLAETADFVIETFRPGYMDELSLGYPALSEINPRIIITSITPYGQTGPYKDYKGCDIVASAMGGLMYIQGDPDRPPVRAATPQAHVQAGVEAAIGTLAAHYHREITGMGQQVDVALQECMALTTNTSPLAWDFTKSTVTRLGSKIGSADSSTDTVFPTKDGYIVGWAGIMGGEAGVTFVEWLEEEGMTGGSTKEKMGKPDSGAGDLRTQDMSQEMVEHREQTSVKLFASHTTEELVQTAQRKRLAFTAMCTPKDILTDAQLVSRNYFVEVEHPELDDTITYLGNPWRMSETPWRIWRRAPLIGEHNEEIYEKELGFSKDELLQLKESGVL